MGEVVILNQEQVEVIPLEQIFERIAAVLGIGITLELVTSEAECEASQLSFFCSNRLDDALYRMTPALITPTRWSPGGLRRGRATTPSEAPPDVFNFVRHGILVKTDRCTGKECVYVYVGGAAREWLDGAERFMVAQGGAYFTTSVNKGTGAKLANVDYPLMMLPVKGNVKNFLQPYDPACRLSGQERFLDSVMNMNPVYRTVEGIQQALNHLSWAGAGLIPTYVPYILQHVFNETLGFTQQVYVKESPNRNRYFLNNQVRQDIITISGKAPLFLPGIIGFPDVNLEGVPTAVIYTNLGALGTPCGPDSADVYTIKSMFTNPRLVGIPQNPLIYGSPVLVGGLCTGGCEGVNVMGFPLPPSSSYSTMPAYSLSTLFPAPRSWSMTDLESYARQLGIYDSFMEALNAVMKAIRVEIILASKGIERELAEKLVNSLSWMGSLFQMEENEIAKAIINEIRSPPHEDHPDEVGQELHDAYLCYRFGHC
ncbi:hypothetical protein [Metallosphaera javensis (ex Sakai et al. 2022)]|uniref:hypothetical protein n=1 Tax=Metallosphaera javensis (ex Sakai et al. 2022) TaxID=2775498 RepID=UPI00258C31E7|nr:MAG: hypothetical protein MjAS7_2899 [Metallosphaera javensis (ex Sakai et al. 2022)]